MLKTKEIMHHYLDEIMTGKINENFSQKFRLFLSLVNCLTNTFLSEKDLHFYLEDEDVQDYIKRSRTFFAEWECYLEKIMNEYIIKQTLPFGIDRSDCEHIKRYYVNQYRKLTMVELDQASIQSHSSVCHVGIGNMPLSLLMHHKYSKKCLINGIDFDPVAVANAQYFIDEKCKTDAENYDNQSIKTSCAEGSTYNYNNFDTVILAASIINKQEIVNQIFATANKNLMLIDRQIYGLNTYIYKGSLFNTSKLTLLTSTQVGLITVFCYSLKIRNFN